MHQSRIALVGMTLLLALPSAFGQLVERPDRKAAVGTSRAPVPQTMRLLNQRIPEITFDQAPLETVMDWVAEFTRMNVVVRWQALEANGIPRDKPVTLRARDLRVAQVLWMIMNEAGGSDIKLAYRASGNLLVLSTEDDLGKEMITKVYDVSDLLTRAPRFAGPEVDITQATQNQGGQGGGGGGGGQGIFQDQNQDTNDQENREQADQEIQRLVELIQQTVEPDTWAANGGTGTITAFRNHLVVRANILVHQRLGGFISE